MTFAKRFIQMFDRVSPNTLLPEAAVCRCSQINILKNFAIFTIKGKHLCWSLFLIKLQTFKPTTFLKETPTQVFLCEYCNIFMNRFFYRTYPVAICNQHQKYINQNCWVVLLLNFNIFHHIHGQIHVTLCSTYLLNIQRPWNNKDLKTSFLTICFYRLCYN